MNGWRYRTSGGQWWGLNKMPRRFEAALEVLIQRWDHV